MVCQTRQYQSECDQSERGQSRPGQSQLGKSRYSLVASCGALFGVAALALIAGGSADAAEEFTTGSSDVIVTEINRQIREGWKDNEVTPSPVADDYEWLRRVYLDICGHVPSLEEVEAFAADKDKAKRTKVIDKLLDDPAYVRNWTTVWTNLCIGQQTPRRVSREGMQKFFREAFGKNRRWNDIVSDLVTA